MQHKNLCKRICAKILTSYIAPNTSVEKVVNKIQLINSSRLSFHKDVADARAELNILRKFSNASLPVGIEQLLLDAEQLVVKDKAAAKEVENAIAALSPKRLQLRMCRQSKHLLKH